MPAVLADLVAVPELVETPERLHIRYRLFNQAMSRSGLVFPTEEVLRTVDDGRCGADDNWKPAPIEALDNADLDRLCRYCFPREG